MTTFVLVAVVGNAAADPAAKSKADCEPRGSVLLEVDQRADRQAKLSTATTRLFENGAWKSEILDVDRKLARSRSGCLAASDVDSIREKVRRATWKTTRSNARCRADQPRLTHYKWKRRVLYTERTCHEDVLDEESRLALDLVEVLLGAPVELDRDDVRCMDNPLKKGCP